MVVVPSNGISPSFSEKERCNTLAVFGRTTISVHLKHSVLCRDTAGMWYGFAGDV